MTKEEAIRAMSEGKKVRHRYFSKGRVGLDCKSSAYGLEGSNPSTPTNLMNMLIGFLVFITLEIAIIATIGFTYFHEDDKNFKNYRKGKNS